MRMSVAVATENGDIVKHVPVETLRPRSYCGETMEIADAMPEPPNDLSALNTLVTALKDAGIWGTLGEITWARDSANGLLLQWTPRKGH